MSFEEEFDKKVRQKAEEASYPFNEADWAKASAMIDADRKVATGGKWARFYVPAALIGVAAAGIFVFTQFGKTAPALVAEKQQVQPIQNVVAAQAPEAGPEAPQSDEALTPLERPKAPASVKTQPTEVNIKQTGASSIQAREAVMPRIKNERTAEKKNAPEIGGAPVVTEEAKVTESPAVTNNGKTNQNETPANNDSGTTPDSDKKAADMLVAAYSAPAERQPAESPVSGQNPVTTPIEANSGVTKEQPAEAPVEEAPVAEYLALRQVVDNRPEEEPRNVPFILLSQYGDDYYKRSRKSKIHFLDLEAGANYNLGWETATGWDGRGVNWFGGFNYGVYRSRKSSVSLGMQLYNVQNMKDPFFSATKTDYDFGSVSSGTLITTNSLLYVGIPVKLYYHFPDKTNRLGIGVNMAYLLNAQSTVQSYSVQDGARTYKAPEKVSGVYDGTAQTNLMFTASYQLKLNRHFGFNTEVVYGLGDLFRNTSAIKKDERTMGLRMSLTYNLFDN